MKRKETFLLIVLSLLFAQCISIKKKHYLSVGLRAYDLSYYKSAVKYLEKAKKIEPNSPKINLYLGLSYMNLGDYYKAKENFENIILSNEKVDSYYLVEAQKALGSIYYYSKLYYIAIPLLKEVTKKDKKWINGKLYLGWSYFYMANYRKALEIFDDITSSHKIFSAYYGKALTLWKLDKKVEAEEFFIKGIKLLSKRKLKAFYYFNFGKLFFKDNNLPKAFEYMSNAIKYDSKLVDAYEIIGEIYLLKNEYYLAKLYFNKALSLNPDNEKVKEKLKMLQNIKK